MSAADPYTDDLPDRLVLLAVEIGNVGYRGDKQVPHDLRAAAAELRRLRDRDAALTRLLDAVGDPEELRNEARWFAADDIGDPLSELLRGIAAAVEDIDRCACGKPATEHAAGIPTCGDDR